MPAKKASKRASAKPEARSKKAPAKRGRGRPSSASTSRAAPGGSVASRRAEIELELDRLAGLDDTSMEVQKRIAALQVQRWTLLSKDPACNFREQGEASREAARWQTNFERCASALATDQLAALMERMAAQEAAADRLEEI